MSDQLIVETVWEFQVGDHKSEWIIQKVTPNIIYYTIIGEPEEELYEETREDWMKYVEDGELRCLKSS